MLAALKSLRFAGWCWELAGLEADNWYLSVLCAKPCVDGDARGCVKLTVPLPLRKPRSAWAASPGCESGATSAAPAERGRQRRGFL